jgi:hypothetical protein
VGFELREINSSAHVGLLHTDPDVYVVVIPERADASESAALIASILTPPSEELTTNCPPMQMPMLGQQWDMIPLESSMAGLEFLHGATYSSGFVVQVLTWYRQADSARVRAILPEGLSSLRWQTEQECKELAARMAAAPDPQNLVTPTACMRGGVVRDFANGYRWTKPAGTWQVSLGDAAREENEDCSFYVEELEAGIFGLVICEDADEMDLDTYTSIVLEQLFEEGAAGEPTPRKFGEGEGFVASGKRSGDFDLEYCVATAKTKKRVYQMLLWGTPKNMQRAHAAVQAALDGFHVLAIPERAVVTTAAAVRDIRVGYAFLRPDKSWKRTPIPLDEIAGAGSGVIYQSDEGLIGVVSVWFDQDRTKEGLFADLAPDLIKKRFANLTSRAAKFARADRPPTESRDEIAGISCRRLTWTDAEGGIDMLFFGRDRTSYMLVAAGPNKSRVLETAKSSLKLLP